MQSTALKATYTDFSGLNVLREQARIDPQASLNEVAKQFEAIFIQMMLKSMRDASMGDAIFDSDQSKLYRDMFDKQISLDMAMSKGIGIADTLIRQLGRNKPELNKVESAKPDVEVFNNHKKQLRQSEIPNNIGKELPLAKIRLNSVDQVKVSGLAHFELPTAKLIEDKTHFNSSEEFIGHILPYAEQAAKELGVSPLLLVSQAALETGWGKAITRHPNGSSTYNLFNIKADNRWQGERITKSTLEYDHGITKFEKASFRAYDSYVDSFDDYVNFLRTNSRYDGVLRNQGNDQLFIQDLHKAGYATDPDYADKILNIFKRDSMQVHARVVENLTMHGNGKGS